MCVFNFVAFRHQFVTVVEHVGTSEFSTSGLSWIFRVETRKELWDLRRMRAEALSFTQNSGDEPCPQNLSPLQCVASNIGL